MHRNGEPFHAFWSRLINFASIDIYTVFIYHGIIHCFETIEICVENVEFTTFCSNILT